MRAYLKIKIKSLSAEARIIRHEERKWRASSRHIRRNALVQPQDSSSSPGDPSPSANTSQSQLRQAQDTLAGLHGHRVGDVRAESRASLLAYGFLRGKNYRSMEAKCYFPPPAGRVVQLVKKYGQLDPLSNKAPEKLIHEWFET